LQFPADQFGPFHRDLFERYYRFTEGLLASGLVWPALEHCLKCSHLFNVLDASNSIGVTERTAYILRVRKLALGIAQAYVGEAAAAGAPVQPEAAPASAPGPSGEGR
jgi:glycyl-tRNA synthetase alpha chain